METDGETGRWEIRRESLTDEQDTERGRRAEGVMMCVYKSRRRRPGGQKGAGVLGNEYTDR